MKKIIILCIGVISQVANSQTTVNIQSSTHVQDAYIWDHLPNHNVGDAVEFEIYAWTNQGYPTVRRGFIKFDLTMIPIGSQIQSANLVLKNNPQSSSTSGEHQQLSGSNAMYLKAVTQNWNESTITWNNQPTVTASNQLYIPASLTANQTYNINVTSMVTNMVNNPSSNFGFCLSLANEQYYRSVILASSEHTDPNLQPVLEIVYFPTASITDNSEYAVSVYPNPANSFLEINTTNLTNASIKAIDTEGKESLSSEIVHSKTVLDVSSLKPGIYILLIENENKILREKFIKL